MDRDKLMADLARDEGLRLKPYRCSAGKLTIGYGRNLDDVGISVGEAESMLRADVAKVVAQLDVAIPWWRSLDEVRQRVVANMTFNLGIDGFLGFKQTIALVQAGKYLEAAQAMTASKWASQVGPRAVRLATMMRDGAGGTA